MEVIKICYTFVSSKLKNMKTTITTAELEKSIMKIFIESTINFNGFDGNKILKSQCNFQNEIQKLIKDFEILIKEPQNEFLENTQIKLSDLAERGFKKYTDGSYGKGSAHLEINIQSGGRTCLQNIDELKELTTFENPITTIEVLDTLCDIALPQRKHWMWEPKN